VLVLRKDFDLESWMLILEFLNHSISFVLLFSFGIDSPSLHWLWRILQGHHSQLLLEIDSSEDSFQKLSDVVSFEVVLIQSLQHPLVWE
jgi:hypothetical protein